MNSPRPPGVVSGEQISTHVRKAGKIELLICWAAWLQSRLRGIRGRELLLPVDLGWNTSCFLEPGQKMWRVQPVAHGIKPNRFAQLVILSSRFYRVNCVPTTDRVNCL